MCDKAVSTNHCKIKFAPECFMTQKMYDKAVNRYFLYLLLFLIGIKRKKRVMNLLMIRSSIETYYRLVCYK